MTDQTTSDALEIAAIVGVDSRTIMLGYGGAETAINRMVTAHVIAKYTLVDQILGEIITLYFFKPDPVNQYFDSAPSEELTIFTHHILDETFLLKKLSIAHAIDPIGSRETKIVQRLNALRNALAHSFRPETRKEYSASGKILYGKLDIRTPDGLRAFDREVDTTINYLSHIAHCMCFGGI